MTRRKAAVALLRFSRSIEPEDVVFLAKRDGEREYGFHERWKSVSPMEPSIMLRFHRALGRLDGESFAFRLISCNRRSWSQDRALETPEIIWKGAAKMCACVGLRAALFTLGAGSFARVRLSHGQRQMDNDVLQLRYLCAQAGRAFWRDDELARIVAEISWRA